MYRIVPAMLIGSHVTTVPSAAPGLFVGAVHVAVCAPVVALVFTRSAG